LAPNSNNQLYIQVFKDNIKEIVKIKDTFPKLSSDKVTEIYKIINNPNQKDKPKFNIMTKDLSKKQIIISISTNNAERVMCTIQYTYYKYQQVIERGKI